MVVLNYWWNGHSPHLVVVIVFLQKMPFANLKLILNKFKNYGFIRIGFQFNFPPIILNNSYDICKRLPTLLQWLWFGLFNRAELCYK